MRQPLRIHKAEANTGALDFSCLLDAPAGKHGFVQAKNGHLYFEDGTRARFIGFNLPTRSNTPDHETADKLAARFASLGVNVIRLHAADAPIGDEPCSWTSCREAPLLDYENGDTRHFHKEGLDRFDYFAARLKERGIYLHIDLHVARRFLPGDGVPDGMPDCLKCYGMVNEHLIDLQKEYARNLLCHQNPYTGLALVDDPAVMTIQINNEDSVLKMSEKTGAAACYREELQRKFNRFLLQKYDDRETLMHAWTHEGVCALHDDEAPEQNTVRIVEGSFFQPINQPLGDWRAENSPARYADYMEFGVQMNRRYYQDMKDFVRSLGAKAPISTSNLLGGAADVYGHIDADIMENNAYFNHPLLPVETPCEYKVAGPTEYVSVNPLTMQRGMGAMATSLVSFASVAAVAGKPFLLSEWNEYGLHPFHSTAYLSTVAYACLNDWDGLILYCHHTSERWDDQPADEILNVFDSYNDPALMTQWGFLASAFLRGLIAPAPHAVDVAYTKNDLTTLPNGCGMPYTFLPYITRVRNVFFDGDCYAGGADVAVNAGFLNGGDMSDASHGVYYAWSPFRDAFRRYKEQSRLQDAAKDAREPQNGVHLGKNLVFDDIQALAGDYDYRAFAAHVDGAMKAWGVLPEGTGVVDGKLISETGEIVCDPENSRFSVRTPACACFSGKPEGEITLSDRVTVIARNARVTLTLLPENDGSLADACSFLLTAVGETGMDDTTVEPTELWPGVRFSQVRMRGKLFADTLEGELLVRAEGASLSLLDPVGRVLKTLRGEKTQGGVRFTLAGDIPSVNYHLNIEG